MYRKNLLLSQSYEGDTSLLVNIGSDSEKFHFLSGERFENRVSFICPFKSYCVVEINGFASVNGIHCLKYGNRFSLWNPTTDEVKVIPPYGTLLPPIVHKYKPADYFHHRTMIHGFGYDSIADDYKVICLETFEPLFGDDELGIKQSLLLQDESLQPFWQIYSLKSNSWKNLYVNMPHSSTLLVAGYHGNFRVYMNGVCHWLSMPHCHWSVPFSAEACMVSFELNNETFFVTPIPFYVRLTWTQLTVLNNSIALIFFAMNTNIFHISILGEVGVKESWIKLLTVEKPCAIDKFPMGVGMNGEIVFANDDDKLLLFDLNTNKIVDLGLKIRDSLTLGQIKVYKKSLLPIKRIN